MWLQWSHVPSDVETCAYFPVASLRRRFKEPRPFRRGNAAGGAPAGPLRRAASMEPRPFRRGNIDHAHANAPSWCSASMEPRPFRRGNASAPRGPSDPMRWLQWSHVPSDVETVDIDQRHGHARNCFNGATSLQTWKPLLRHPPPVRTRMASMEPRPFRRGNTESSLQITKTQDGASMEPRPFRRGNDILVAQNQQLTVALQWSHVPSDVETYAHRTMSVLRSCFNGATSLQTWKQWRCQLARASVRSLQWSHVPSDVETCLRLRTAEHQCASMEPRPFERGNDVRLSSDMQYVGFNGATSIQTWKQR